MDIFGQVGSVLGGGIFSLVAFLFVLTLVVFFHELGHFSVARLFKTRIETFAVGFGRELYGWTDRHGTRWKLGILPFGGYVKFWGDETAASTPDAEELARLRNDPDASACFHFKPLYQRAAIVAAGPLANFVFAIVVFSALFIGFGDQVQGTTVSGVSPGGAAEASGVRPGDKVVAVDGHTVQEFNDIVLLVMTSGGRPLEVLLERGGNPLALTVTPTLQVNTGAIGSGDKVWRLGIEVSSADAIYLPIGPLEAVPHAIERVYDTVAQTFFVLGRVVFQGAGADQLSGPLGIAKVSGEAASLGFWALISLTAALSISVGLLNLFPIPMLDGGHLLYYAFEAVRGRPLGERAQEYGFRIGLALVFTLMVFATWNDIAKHLWS